MKCPYKDGFLNCRKAHHRKCEQVRASGRCYMEAIE